VTNSKPEFAEVIGSEKKLVEKAENLLKEAISEYKETFKASM
jgi:F-type H+-transporting ATPase subunit alpha